MRYDSLRMLITRIASGLSSIAGLDEPYLELQGWAKEQKLPYVGAGA
jgi:hypothetical protein